jgi:hypothetical protein
VYAFADFAFYVYAQNNYIYITSLYIINKPAMGAESTNPLQVLQ